MDDKLDKETPESSGGKTINRRRFLELGVAAGAAIGAAGLASCGGTATPTTAPVPTTAPQPTTAPVVATTAPTKAPTAVATKAAASPTAGAAAEAPVLTPIASELDPKWKGTGQITVAAWGGAGQDAERAAFFKPFQDLSGISVKEDSDPTNGKIKAMVDGAVVDWDVVDIDPMVPFVLNKGGDYFEPIDYSMVNVDEIDERFRYKYSVGVYTYAYVLAFRTDVYTGSNVPKSWADFWDVQKFPGPRAMYGIDPFPNPEIALMADGVDPSKVYETLQASGGMDRAFKKLDEIKPHITKWWDSGASIAQLMTDKEIHMACAWNGRIVTAKSQGVPVDITWNQAIVATDAWAVPKGSKNAASAMKFIGFATSSRPQARFPLLYPNGCINTKAASLLPEATLATMPSSPQNLKQGLVMDSQYWAEIYDVTNERFTAWKTS